MAEAEKKRLPAGFEETANPGWLHHPDRGIFLEVPTGRSFWFDQAADVHRELHEGQDLTSAITVLAGATTAASSSGSRGREAAQARHVVILDFHKAAEAYRLDLGHIDRPAAMLAVYGSAPGAVSPELAARSLHEKLLRRLGRYRSKWSENALQALLAETFTSLAAEHGAEQGMAAAAALILGPQIVTVASRGSSCVVALPHTDGSPAVCAGSNGEEVSVGCSHVLPGSTACVLLLTSAIKDPAVAASHSAKGRPRAGAAAMLQELTSGSATGAAACARVQWGVTEAVPGPAKKQRTDGSETKVRCRKILLKYLGCRHATDPVRRLPVRRSLAQAEAILLKVLSELESGGTAAFTSQCRALSECNSALKGGDLAGDVGWLTRPVEKPGEKLTKEQASKNALIRAVFELDTGEFSDILISDDGAHVFQRIA